MIRRRLMLIAAPLCVVMVAAGVAFASTTDTERATDVKPDDPHVVRPIAASTSDLDPVLTAESIRTSVQHLTAKATLRAAVAAAWQAAADRDAAAAFAASLEAPVVAQPTGSVSAAPGSSPSSAPAAPASSASSAGTAGGALACIRAHESDSAGGYQAVSSSGTYRGAYQFAQSTWDNSAGAAGRADLVGVDPASASPADQDAVASYLYSQAGDQPWGNRC